MGWGWGWGGVELKFWILEEWNQLEARYALMTEYWNKLILVIFGISHDGEKV
jgi:hypothetical protein